jgi:DNA-binding LacI/PurR family transcriptional regulator
VAVTVADVARRAGVSTATVSYVLNDNPNQRISPATRESVLRAADDLGYRPNVAARSLRTGRGTAVLLPLPGLHGNHVLGLLIDQCAARLVERELSLVTDYSAYATPEQALRAWAPLNPAAVVVLPHDAPIARALARSGIPVVTSPQTTDDPWESHADAFAREARVTQLQYLLSRGHRRVAFMWPPQVEPAVERRMTRQLRAVARSAGATLDVVRAPLTADAFSSYADAWVRDRRAEAIACFNDDFAMGLLSALAQRGVAAPDDVAVMGVDDVPLAAAFTPPLTTIAADFSELAGALAETVAAVVRQGETSFLPLPLPQHSVVVRRSA